MVSFVESWLKFVRVAVECWYAISLLKMVEIRSMESTMSS